MIKSLFLFLVCPFLYGFTLNNLTNPVTCDGMTGFVTISGMFIISGCDGVKGSEDLTSTGSTGLAYTTIYTHSGANCDVNYIELYADDMDSTAFKMAIWDDDSGPSNALAWTGAVASPNGWAWTGAALNTTVTLQNGATYYFGFRANNTIGYGYVTATAATYYSSGGSYETFPPMLWTVRYTINRLLAIRASYQ